MPFSFKCSGCGSRLTDGEYDLDAGVCIYCSGAFEAATQPKRPVQPRVPVKPKVAPPPPAPPQSAAPPKPVAPPKPAPPACSICGGTLRARPVAKPGFREPAMRLVCEACGYSPSE